MTQIFFSPGGTTAQIAGQVSAALAQDVQTVDLLREPPANPVQLGPDQLVLAAMPVFSGRIPGVCADAMKQMKGGQTPAAAPRKTDKEHCIACTACLYACPSKARSFRGPLYKIAGKSFAEKNSARKEPETFVPGA